MCGRFVLNTEPNVIQQTFNLESVPDLEPRFNIAPSQAVPVITNDDPQHLTMVQWGLIPSWAKDRKMAYKMINARGETVAEKPSYRSPFKYRRCLIPVSGFYEWTKTDDGKQPHFIHVKDEPVFAFAGLWEVWHAPEGDEVWTTTIITTEANEALSDLHHRMPVILDGDARDIWLDKASDAAALQALLQPYADEKMAHYPVSKAVNNVRNDGPTLLDRHEPPTQQGLL